MEESLLTIFSSLSLAMRKTFIADHSCLVIDDSARAITLDAGAGICMVCVVEHLEKDVTWEKDMCKLVAIIKKCTGKS